MVVHK